MPTASETPGFESLRWLSDRPASFVPRTMLVLAHPDDETIGAGSILPRLSLAYFVYATDGAPYQMDDAHRAGCTTREQYAAVRRGELLSALESVGIGPERIDRVDVPDQDASRQLAALTRWFEVLFREHAPDVVLTHPYEGGHPDHDATAFAVHQACRRMRRLGEPSPLVVEFTSYHAGTDGGWVFGEFLSVGSKATEPAVTSLFLTPADRALKRRLLGCYASQQAVLRNVPLECERFRIAPEYDFLQPPHPGQLLYERFPWGMTGAAWRNRARIALGELFDRSPTPVPSAAASVALGESLTVMSNP